MSQNQKFLIVALIIALGASFEILKKVSFSDNTNGEINSLLSSFDMRPFAKTHGEGSLAGKDNSQRARPARRHRMDEPMRALQQLAANTQETKKEEKLDLGDTGKKKTDKDKKKKKKKKKKGSSSEDGTDESVEDESSGDDDIADTDSDEPVDAPAATAAPNENPGGFSPLLPNTNEDQKPLHELIAHWSAELLKSPNYKLLNEFVSLKQTGAIPEDVFYPVVQMLLDDSREGIQLMGVHALGATPSQMSFEKLIATRRDAAFGSQVSQNIGLQLQSYINLNQLVALRNVLYSSEDFEALREAAQLVEQSASRYLNVIASAENEPVDVSATATALKHGEIFKGFTSILESLAESSTDQQVVSAAAQALSRIQKYLPESPQEDPDDNLVSTI